MTLKVHCPECRGQFQVDGEESRSRFECPFCTAPFRFQDKQTVVLSSSPLTKVEVERIEPSVAAVSPSPSPSPAAAPPEPAPAAPRSPQPVPEDLTPLRPGDVVGGYRLEAVIGYGGMSVVFRAKQLSLGRDVALKVMRRELGDDPEFSRRFLNEARALAELSHPNIVQVIDQGIHAGNHFLVMEYIDGVSLREVLTERRLSPAEALRIVPDLCSALEYAHDRGIIHRDIKPENILLARNGRPKIADFGLVRMLGTTGEPVSRLTQTRTVLGTVDYMAPEQRAGASDVDHRADIYSLGVVLYEMLTGELPIARFALPSERVQVDVRIDDVVLKVLEKDRDRRYQRASLVATDLERLGDAPRPWHPAAFFGHRVPASLPGRVFALLWFPVVIGFFGAAADAPELAIFVTGAAIPWFLLHLRSYGWLPALPEAILARRWLLVVASLAFLVLTASDALEEEPGIFALALCLSGAIALRRSVWGPGTDPAAPNAAPGLVRAAPPRRRAPPAAPLAAPLPAAAAASPAKAAAPHGAAPISLVSAPPPNTLSPRLEETMPSAPAALSMRPRTSVPLFLGFLAALVTLLLSAGVSIPLFVVGDSWQTIALNVPMEYHELDEMVREAAPYSPEAARTAATGLRTMLFAPLAVPLLLSLLSLPGVLTGKRRGPALLLAVLALLGIETALIASATQPVAMTFERYCAEFEAGGGSPEELLQVAEASRDPVSRLASLHRAAGVREAISKDPDSGAPLVRMALDPQLTAQERKISLIVLELLYSDALTGPDAFPSCPGWLERFTELARPESQVPPELRAGFVEVLSRVPRRELGALFRQIVDLGTRESLVALRWWTQVAPEAEFDLWVDELERSGAPLSLARAVDRLNERDSGANPRVGRLEEALSIAQ